MAVNAKNRAELTIEAANIRYSMQLDSIGGQVGGSLDLQRSQRGEDGAWLDDPQTGARKRVPLPDDKATQAAVTKLLDVVPSFLGPLGVEGLIKDVRLRLRGNLAADGKLVVSVSVQANTAGGWQVKQISDLTKFLSANPALAEPVLAAWDRWTRRSMPPTRRRAGCEHDRRQDRNARLVPRHQLGRRGASRGW